MAQRVSLDRRGRLRSPDPFAEWCAWKRWLARARPSRSTTCSRPSCEPTRSSRRMRKDSGRVNTSASSALPPVGERDHVTGSSRLKLTLVEYGDFGCPYCFQASRPVKSLLDRFGGLRLVWRHFPVPALHPRADLAAELSEPACTGSSGTHIRCSLHRAGGSHTTTCSRWQGDLSSTQRRPTRPFASTRFESASSPTSRGGRRAGVHATPTFFVDGERLDRPWREVPQIVRASLATA
jgi:Thioredoxin